MSLAAASKSILPELTLQPNETEQGSAPVVVATAGSESTVCGPLFAIVGVRVVCRAGLTQQLYAGEGCQVQCSISCTGVGWWTGVRPVLLRRTTMADVARVPPCQGETRGASLLAL